MSSLIKAIPVLFFFIFLQLSVVQANNYKSILDFIRHRTQTTTTIVPSVTFSVSSLSSPVATPISTTKEPNIVLTLLEKVVVAICSTVITSITGFVFVCAFKCYRNNGRLKASWFQFKVHGYHQNHHISLSDQHKSINLVEISPQPSIESD